MENNQNDDCNENDYLITVNKISFANYYSSSYKKNQNITTNENANVSTFEQFCCNISLIFGPAIICFPFIIQKCGMIPSIIAILLLSFLSFIASQCLIDSHRLINGIKSIHLNHFSYTNLIDNLIDDKLFSVSMKIGVAANHFTYALLCIITLSQIFIYYNNFHFTFLSHHYELSLYLKNLIIIGIVVVLFLFISLINSLTNRKITSVLIVIFSFFVAGNLVLHCWTNKNNLKINKIPLVGKDFSFLYGTIIFSFCFISSIPTWLSENDLKSQKSKSKKILQHSLGYSTLFKLLFMLSFGYLLTFNNLFNFNSFHSQEMTNKFLIHFLFFFFILVLLQSSFTQLKLLFRTLQKELDSYCFSIFVLLLPFIFGYIFLILYNKSIFIQIINWSSIFLFGIINFIYPLFLYVEAINKTELFEDNYIQSALIDYETFVRGAVIECEQQSDEIVNMLISEKSQKEKIIYYIYSVQGYYSIKKSICEIFGFGFFKISIQKIRYTIYGIIFSIFALMFISLYVSLYKYLVQKALVVNIFIQI